jgi:geranylgeranyl diphosphate synthase, type II
LSAIPISPIVSPPSIPSTTIDGQATSGRTNKRRNTSHLKLVPQSRELRDSLRRAATEVAARLDKRQPLTKDQMEQVARELLAREGQPEGYVGWMMVVLSSEFWHDQVASVPFSRRLFLLPHCLKHAEGCPAEYNEFGMDCRKCGACSISDFRTQAEDLGYKVLVAEGSPVVMKIIVSGYVDAIVGVACLNVLEKAIDKILLAGIPCMAVPLLSSDCRNTSVDDDWVSQFVATEHRIPTQQTRSYVHLMRSASELFEPSTLQRVAPMQRTGQPLDRLAIDDPTTIDPVSLTERIAYDFLARGGKYARPFITLAAYDAMRGGVCTDATGAQAVAEIPDAVKRAALSIEAFHKASLVHDDIEDDDAYRYGQLSIHRRFGTSTAINVGDYMIGMGYRLVSRESKSLGADAVADVLDCLANAHTRLAEGQGAELFWRDARDKQLAPLDALKVYALKTAPAFEAALYAGVRLGGDASALAEPIKQFARNLGVAFQILNDLKDWEGDDYNKLQAGGDTLGGRPTVLWALALQSLEGTDRQALLDAVDPQQAIEPSQRLANVKRLYQQAGVFELAHRLVDKHQQRASEVADKVQPADLQRLLRYLIDTVLERTATSSPTVVPWTPSMLPITTRS